MPPVALSIWTDRACAAPRRAPAPLPGQWHAALVALRVAALECRTAQRCDLFRACALLSLERPVQRGAYTAALVRGLHTARSAAPVFLRPQESELSFDEAWLVSALRACAGGDWDSFDFLIRSRIAAQYRRNVAFLVRGVSEIYREI